MSKKQMKLGFYAILDLLIVNILLINFWEFEIPFLKTVSLISIIILSGVAMLNIYGMSRDW